MPKPHQAEVGQDLIETLAVVPILFLMLVAAIWISGAFMGAGTQNANVRTDNALYWQCGESPGGCGAGGGGVNPYNAVLESGAPAAAGGLDTGFVWGSMTAQRSIATFGALPALAASSSHTLNTQLFQPNTETAFDSSPPTGGAVFINPVDYGIIATPANRDALKTVKIWLATPTNPCGGGPAITGTQIDGMVGEIDTYQAFAPRNKTMLNDYIPEDYVPDSAPDETDIDQEKQGSLAGFSVGPTYAEQTYDWANSQEAYDPNGNEGKPIYTDCADSLSSMESICRVECNIYVANGRCEDVEEDCETDVDGNEDCEETVTSRPCFFSGRYNDAAGNDAPYACEEICVRKHFKACVVSRITGFFTAFRNETLEPIEGCKELVNTISPPTVRLPE